ncbi:MAG: hypothetical protein J2P36_13855, partial [Ktedonobacteraceae bacterium]|nr:hypothetical protein [Ktedonobacteraceae bacterium]
LSTTFPTSSFTIGSAGCACTPLHPYVNRTTMVTVDTTSGSHMLHEYGYAPFPIARASPLQYAPSHYP